MANRLELRRHVEWVDTDASGIWHYSTALRFAEVAEAALHRSLGIAGRTFGASPRVHVEADFRRPLRFGDEATISIGVVEIGTSSVRYEVEISGPDGAHAATVGFVTAHIDVANRSSTPLPAPVRAALEAAGDVR